MKLQLNKEIQGARTSFYKRTKTVRNAIKQTVNFILPPRCALSGTVVSAQGELSPDAWSELEFITDPQCKICGVPFDFQIDTEMECASCLKKRPLYERARAALIYNDHSRNIILRFKHADQMHILHSFMPWVMRVGEELISEADLIIPVPLHRFRLLKRRYNQAAVMSQYLSRMTGKEWSYNLLCRKRMTKSQGFMKPEERQKNVREAFIIPLAQQDKLDGKNILLIDDVYTTGATVNECVKTLLKYGAKEVNVLTIAKVVRR